MRVLKLHAANHLRNFEQMAKARRPVRHSQPGIIARNQPAGNNQQESQTRNKHSKAMLSGVVCGRGQNSSWEVLVILSIRFSLRQLNATAKP